MPQKLLSQNILSDTRIMGQVTVGIDVFDVYVLSSQDISSDMSTKEQGYTNKWCFDFYVSALSRKLEGIREGGLGALIDERR